MSDNHIFMLIASSLAIGIGFGLVIGDKPFVLEATATPFGSFILRYNPTTDFLSPSSPPALQESTPSWYNYTA